MGLVLAATEAELRVVRAALAEPIGAGTVTVARTGVGPEASRRFCQGLDVTNAGRVALVGWAGALQASLRRATVVVARATLDTEGRSAECAPLTLPGAVVGDLLTVAVPLATSAAKAEAAAATDALAAEMEGAPLAEWALLQGTRLHHVRVILDERDQALPDITGLLSGDGRLAALGFARLLCRPGQVALLARVAWHVWRTEWALATAARGVWHTWQAEGQA